MTDEICTHAMLKIRSSIERPALPGEFTCMKCGTEINMPYLSRASTNADAKWGEMHPVEKGIKHDAEKNQLELLSASWIEGVGRVLTFGARKYAAHNWRKGLDISRLLGACLRHVFAFLRGENCDPESGLSHLYHASCCLMFASELLETKPEFDDRYKS